MFLMAKDMGWRLAGMPMDVEMYGGMALIVGGVALAAYGLLPTPAHINHHEIETLAPPEDMPLTGAHWRLLILLSIALIIDIMKPASLGFVTPGMRMEYAIDKATVALLPFSALCGTVVGSFVWGLLADIYGRRASILTGAFRQIPPPHLHLRHELRGATLQLPGELCCGAADFRADRRIDREAGGGCFGRTVGGGRCAARGGHFLRRADRPFPR